MLVKNHGGIEAAQQLPGNDAPPGLHNRLSLHWSTDVCKPPLPPQLSPSSHRRAFRAHAGKRIKIDMILRQIQAPENRIFQGSLDSARTLAMEYKGACWHTNLQAFISFTSILVQASCLLRLKAMQIITSCSSHPMRRFRWWIVLNIKTYLIIPHNRDAVANEIKSCALDHELDEFNTGNAKADRSCLGLYLCYSIQAMPWKSAALLEYTLQKSQEIQTPSYTTLSDYTVERFQETRVLS